MGPNGPDEGRGDARLQLPVGSGRRENLDLVFEFTGLHGLDLTDLALVLTARLRAGPSERVWVRGIPYETWDVLRALGLDHLFHVYPGQGDGSN